MAIKHPPITNNDNDNNYIITTRSTITENRYLVHAAITTADGTLLLSTGDPNRITLHRSAAKPAQTLAVLSTTPIMETHNMTSAEIALMCASHNAEPRHINLARSMLAKFNVDESSLMCGGHPSICPNLNREWIKADFVPGPIENNCSGKHVGMLGGARALGVGVEGYHLLGHPMQVRVRQVVEELAGIEGMCREDGEDGEQDEDKEEIQWGIDGCNLPAPASRLKTLARIYASFAHAAGLCEMANGEGKAEGESAVESEQAEKDDSRTKTMGTIFRAMTEHPELVGGHGRFCTDLMQTFGGALIGKVGADGCYGVGIRASEQTRRLGAEGAVGIAVKIEDGNQNILYSAVVEILEQLQIGTVKQRQMLAKYHKQDILNTAGVVTGKVSHLFKLRRTGEV